MVLIPWKPFPLHSSTPTSPQHLQSITKHRSKGKFKVKCTRINRMNGGTTPSHGGGARKQMESLNSGVLREKLHGRKKMDARAEQTTDLNNKDCRFYIDGQSDLYLRLAFCDETSSEVNMAVNTLPMEGKIRNKTYAFSQYDCRNMLILLKDLALEPCNMTLSHKRLQNQMLKVRKLLNASARRPQRKRKYNLYENDSKLPATFGPISREKYGNKTAKNRRRDESSSFSSSPLSKEKWGSLQGIQEDVALPALNDRAEYCSLSRQDYSQLCDKTEQWGSLCNDALLALNDRTDYGSLCRQDYSHQSDIAEPWVSLQGAHGNGSLFAVNDRSEYSCVCRQDCCHLSDSDESIKGPHLMKQGNLESHCEDVVTDYSCTHSTETSIMEETNMEILDVSKSSVDGDFDVSSEASPHSLSSEKEDMELNQLHKKFLPSRLIHFPRLAIPIGPRFEAEVPKWEGTTNVRHYNCDDLKWLGTQIWPMPDITESNTNGIGKGRSEPCSCDILGSVDCVQQHVNEARKLLQSEIGTAFSSWKFDEMGEDVSKSWTLGEQKEFESLVKLSLSSEDTDFWKLAMEHFPAKSIKSMVNYYYNVYIPRRMSMETRSSFAALDSDNDQNEDYKNEDGCSATRMRIVPIFKLLKLRKLSGPRNSNAMSKKPKGKKLVYCGISRH